MVQFFKNGIFYTGIRDKIQVPHNHILLFQLCLWKDKSDLS